MNQPDGALEGAFPIVRRFEFAELNQMRPQLALHTAKSLRAIPGYPRIDVRPDIMFIDSQGRQWLRRGYRGEITEASMQDSIDIVATNPGAYTSYEDHPTMSLPTSPEQDRGQRVD